MAEINQSGPTHAPVRPNETRAGLGFAVLLLLGICLYWKLILTDQYTWLDGVDLAHQVLPWLQYQAGEWHAGRFPLWAPFEWGGQPLAGQAQPSVLYPPNWLLYLAPLKNGWIRFDVLHGYYLLLHVFAAWFQFLLCRHLGSSFAGSIAGGLVFGFGGYVGTNDWPQMLNGAIWAPLIFLFHLKAIDGISHVSDSVIAGAFLGLSWLSGHHQVPIFLSLALATSCCWFLYRRKLSVIAAVASFGTAGLVGAMQILPALEYGRLAHRWVGLEFPVDWKLRVPYFLHEQWGLHPASIFGIVFPGMHVHASPFAGIAGTVLAILGLRRRPYFAALAAGGLLYALAGFGVLEGLFYSLVPMVEKARSPAMAVVVFSLALGPLVAAGIDSLGSEKNQRLRQILIGGGACLLAFYFGLAVVRNNLNLPEQRPMLTAIAALTAAGLLAATAHRARLGFVVLLLIELSWLTPYFFRNRYQTGSTSFVEPMSQYQEVVDYLRTLPGPVRIRIDDETIRHNFGDWHGVDVFGGYLASLTSNLIEFDHSNSNVVKMMGVTHWVGTKPLYDSQPLVFRGVKGIGVYAMPDPLPRLWTVHQVFRADRSADIGRLLWSPSFDFRQAAVTHDEIPLERCSGDHASILRYTPSEVVAAAEMSCRGLLILGDIDFPGWRVRVDGRDAGIRTVNGMQRGVVLDRGWHRVEFAYRPVSVYAGAGITLLGTLFALGASIMKRRQQ